MRLLRFHHRGSGHAQRARPRTGRALVECCVAMLLLAVTGTAVLVGAAGSARLVDESRQRDLVQRGTRDPVARAAAVPCAVHGASLRIALTPRVVLDVVEMHVGAVRSVRVDAWWQATPFAGGAWQRHQTLAGGWCE